MACAQCLADGLSAIAPKRRFGGGANQGALSQSTTCENWVGIKKRMIPMFDLVLQNYLALHINGPIGLAALVVCAVVWMWKG